MPRKSADNVNFCTMIVEYWQRRGCSVSVQLRSEGVLPIDGEHPQCIISNLTARGLAPGYRPEDDRDRLV